MKGLRISGLSHNYGDLRVLDNIDMTVPAGQLVCLLGPSGCGKSTLLRVSAGLERVQRGTIAIDGVTVADAGLHIPPERRHVGLMFQDYALFPHLNVIDNVTFGLLGMKSDKADERGRQMLAQFAMTGHADKYPHMLSGGQQQRVAMARALAPRPKLLLLDEPFSGLDASLRQDIREQTLGVLKRSGVATLMVTHDPEEAMFMADRIKIIGAAGRILQDGPPDDIYYRPRHQSVAGMFGMMNRFEGLAEAGRVATPLGPVASELPDGSPAQVLIRPEGVILDETGGENTGGLVEVVSCHLLGHDNIVRVRLIDGDRRELYVRVHHAFKAEPKKIIAARISPEYAFVFAADAG